MPSAIIALLVLFAITHGSLASDPDMLQDVCVADRKSGITVNGFTCKPVASATAEDFFFDGLKKPGNTNNIQGSIVTAASVMQIPGLNTLGVSMARIDYAPGGQNPPNIHPRATGIVFMLEGELDVGFITTANVLISKKIRKGEVFIFPKGLVHFHKNNGHVPAALIAILKSQSAGTQSLAVTLFDSNPPVPDNVLAMAFQIGQKEVQKIKATKLTP